MSEHAPCELRGGPLDGAEVDVQVGCDEVRRPWPGSFLRYTRLPGTNTFRYLGYLGRSETMLTIRESKRERRK